MNFENLTSWLISLLKQRGVKPDGRLLFAYDLSQGEYEELGHELSKAVSVAGGIETLAEISLGLSRQVAQ